MHRSAPALLLALTTVACASPAPPDAGNDGGMDAVEIDVAVGDIVLSSPDCAVSSPVCTFGSVHVVPLANALPGTSIELLGAAVDGDSALVAWTAAYSPIERTSDIDFVQVRLSDLTARPVTSPLPGITGGGGSASFAGSSGRAAVLLGGFVDGIFINVSSDGATVSQGRHEPSMLVGSEVRPTSDGYVAFAATVFPGPFAPLALAFLDPEGNEGQVDNLPGTPILAGGVDDHDVAFSVDLYPQDGGVTVYLATASLPVDPISVALPPFLNGAPLQMVSMVRSAEGFILLARSLTTSIDVPGALFATLPIAGDGTVLGPWTPVPGPNTVIGAASLIGSGCDLMLEWWETSMDLPMSPHLMHLTDRGVPAGDDVALGNVLAGTTILRRPQDYVVLATPFSPDGGFGQSLEAVTIDCP